MSDSPPPLVLRGARVDLTRSAVMRDDGSSSHLTPTEASLLAFLAEHPGEALSREVLLQAVWGYRKGVRSRALDTAVKTLRRKVERDPRQPDHIHTVRGVGYRFEPGSPAAPPARPRGALVGREEESEALARALTEHAVVTLVGPGGIGKTTLARVLLAARGGLWVDLSHATDVDDVLGALAAALGPHAALRDAAAVAARMATLEAGLWVLDNCEQVAGDVADVIGQIRTAAPDSRWLLTSRVPPAVPDAAVVELGPLAEDDAVALLVARGAARRPTFADSDPDVLADIASAVDRVPLALELVGARAGLLDAVALRDRLGRLDWLRDDRRAPRHRSLDEAVRWSWALLDDDARATLAAASLFAGAFSIEALEAVRGARRGALLDEVERLRQASLITAVDGGPLFRLLGMVRAWAATRLEDRHGAEDRLADWLCSTLVDADPEPLVRHRDTLRQLLDGQRARRPAVAVQLALHIERALTSTGPMTARLRAADDVVSLADDAGDDPAITEARLARARAREAVGRDGVSDDLQRALEAAERDGDPILRGRVLGRLGTFALNRGDLDEADEHLTASVALLEATGDRRSLASRYSNLANIASLRGFHERALDGYRRALALHEEVGNRVHAAKVLGGIGTVHLRMGRVRRAKRWFEQALQAHEAAGHLPGVLRMAGNLANSAHALGELDTAEVELRRTRDLARELDEPLIEGVAELCCTGLKLERGDDVAAERHAGRCRVLLERVGAGAYLARLDVWEGAVAWVAGEQDRGRSLLEGGLERLAEVGDRRTLARARGLLRALTGEEDPSLSGLARDAEDREEPLTARWLAVCDAVGGTTGDERLRALDALDAFAASDAAQETDLRILAGVVRTILTV